MFFFRHPSHVEDQQPCWIAPRQQTLPPHSAVTIRRKTLRIDSALPQPQSAETPLTEFAQSRLRGSQCQMTAIVNIAQQVDETRTQKCITIGLHVCTQIALIISD